MKAPVPPDPMGLLWWKVTLDRDGTVLGCEQVEEAARGSRLVCYVQATQKVDAVRSAKEWLTRRREANRRAAARSREKQLNRGLCTYTGCSCLPAPGRKMCTPHAEVSRRAVQAYASRKRGDLSAPPLKRTPIVNAVGAHEFAKLKGEQYKKAGLRCSLHAHIVLEKFDALGPEKFRAWLVEKIEASKGAPDAPQAAE